MKPTTAPLLSTILTLLLFLPFTIANPPACLLSAVGEQDKPADLAAICGSDAINVQAAIDSACASQFKSTAQEEFLATCSGVGSSVAAYTPSSSPSTTGSGTSNTASEIAAGATAASSSSGCSDPSGGYSDVKAFGGVAVLVAAGVLGLAVGL